MFDFESYAQNENLTHKKKTKSTQYGAMPSGYANTRGCIALIHKNWNKYHLNRLEYSCRCTLEKDP